MVSLRGGGSIFLIIFLIINTQVIVTLQSQLSENQCIGQLYLTDADSSPLYFMCFISFKHRSLIYKQTDVYQSQVMCGILARFQGKIIIFIALTCCAQNKLGVCKSILLKQLLYYTNILEGSLCLVAWQARYMVVCLCVCVSVCVECYSCSRVNEVQVRVSIGVQSCFLGY